jgi:hypothetical protein
MQTIAGLSATDCKLVDAACSQAMNSVMIRALVRPSAEGYPDLFLAKTGTEAISLAFMSIMSRWHLLVDRNESAANLDRGIARRRLAPDQPVTVHGPDVQPE